MCQVRIVNGQQANINTDHPQNWIHQMVTIAAKIASVNGLHREHVVEKTSSTQDKLNYGHSGGHTQANNYLKLSIKRNAETTRPIEATFCLSKQWHYVPKTRASAI